MNTPMSIFRAWMRTLKWRQHPNAPQQVPATRDQFRPFSYESILLVNRDADVRDLLAETLVKAGYEVCNTRELAATVEYLRWSHPALLILRGADILNVGMALR